MAVKVPIELVQSQSSWVRRFAIEAARLKGALGAKARRIEHIGSTAVPGLMAKDVVDILLAADAFAEDSEYITLLQPLGYRFRPDPDDRGHRLFHLSDVSGRRLVNLHVCLFGGEWESEKVAFRDRLREDLGLKAQYQELKRTLALQYDNAEDYAEAKSSFIASVLAAGWVSSMGAIAGASRRPDRLT